MKTIQQNHHDDKVVELAEQYRKKGFVVREEPSKTDLPFDLGNYRPDLLVEKGDDHFLIEVKNGGSPLAIGGFQGLAEEVNRHSGWRFLLVTTDEDSANQLPDGVEDFVSTQGILTRLQQARQLVEIGAADAALLTLWAALEALLRRHAASISLPIDRLPTSSLVKHLYSQAELSIDQFDDIMAASVVRNRVAHGFAALNSIVAVERLEAVLMQLLKEWSQPA